MIKYILIMALIFVNCGDQYPTITPKYVTTGQINFKGIDGTKKNAIFLYSVPTQYLPQKSWPLLITLHGYGSNATAFHELWKSVTDSLGFVLLTPQGDERTEEDYGWTWGKDAEREVLMCMDVVRKTVHINPRRIYLAGFSAGGRLTYYLGLKYSNVFKGIAPLSASFDEEFLKDNKIFLSKLRAYIGHGTLEKNAAIDSEIAVSKLRELGITVKYVPYEGIGHNLPDPKERELLRILEFLDSGS
ncbi:hypothetical protein KAR48_15545 [bacterium]|nr:hypothetical protein [bacterium]